MPMLPESFPHLAVLQAAGVNTEAQLAKFSDDYTQIPGIGPAFAADIAAAVAAEPAAAEAADASAEAAEAEAPAEAGTPCRFQVSRDEIVDGTAFRIDADSGVAARVETASAVYENVRPAALRVGSPDVTGCYDLEAAGG